MKKLMIAILCLMLVLPLHAFADDTESQPAGNQTTESKPTESKPAESQPPTESKPAESQPTESKPAESQPTESKPAESQPSESQPIESKPAETQPSESKPAETQPSNHNHVWDVSYTIPATCLQEGAAGYGCSACGAISVEVLPKLTTHTYDNVCDPHCNVCDQNREVTHKFSTQWTRKAAGHWHACSVCGEQNDFGKHYPGPAATEEKAQICLTCGYTLTAKLGHTHKYETAYTSDETGHWYACSGCDEQKDFEGHSYDDGCDADCNVCGYRASTAHSYSGTWYSDETGHWDVCTICQEESPVEPHIPGPEATETEAQTCVACSFELAPALAPTEHVHVGEGSWLTDGENHWKTCACGEETEKQPHNWDEGEEQEDTTTLYTCEDCGTTRIEGEPETDGGVSPLVWMGLAIAVLLGGAVIVVLLLIPKLGKGGKYRK